jgi:Ni,Fe-hydrogenase III small subunit/NAD-dependent dihydropyrimidine dehydrogenase PreA subunit
VVPERFRGLPALDQEKCIAGCTECETLCPTGAIQVRPKLTIDLGKCLFCGDCQRGCPSEAITFSRDYRLGVRKREDLLLGEEELLRAESMGKELLKLYGRSFKLRQVSAGGCNGCEVDINVLGTNVFDLGRFGIQIVASPRHADALIVTGPVSENMRDALLKTWDAVPSPRLVIAVGSCAISGGPFRGHEQVHNGVASLLPVDLYIPGCPPHPITILDGLLRLLGRR